MPTIIPADRWDFNPDAIETGFAPNHGQTVTPAAVIESMEEIENRPEMRELDQMLINSPYYGRGKQSE